MANTRREINDFVKVMLAVMKNNRDADLFEVRKKYYELLTQRQKVGLDTATEARDAQKKVLGGLEAAKSEAEKKFSGFDMGALKKAVAFNESGNQRFPYQARGPVVKEDRAYGKYQVMGKNIPSWTQKFYGKRLSTNEFMANKDAQERVFEGRMTELYKQHGTVQDVLSGWFTGKAYKGNENKTDGYSTNKAYVAKALKTYSRAAGQKDESTGDADLPAKGATETSGALDMSTGSSNDRVSPQDRAEMDDRETYRAAIPPARPPAPLDPALTYRTNNMVMPEDKAEFAARETYRSAVPPARQTAPLEPYLREPYGPRAGAPAPVSISQRDMQTSYDPNWRKPDTPSNPPYDANYWGYNENPDEMPDPWSGDTPAPPAGRGYTPNFSRLRREGDGYRRTALERGITGDDNGDIPAAEPRPLTIKGGKRENTAALTSADDPAAFEDQAFPGAKKKTSRPAPARRTSSTATPAGKPTQLAGAVGRGDYQSNSRRVVNPDDSINWGTDAAGYDDEGNPGGNAADFFRADRELMRRSRAQEKKTSAIPDRKMLAGKDTSTGDDSSDNSSVDWDEEYNSFVAGPEESTPSDSADAWGDWQDDTPSFDAANDWEFANGGAVRRYADGGPVETALPEESEFGMEDAATFFRNDPYRTGGQTVDPPEPPAGDSVLLPNIGEMIGGGLKYLQNVFGLNQTGAVPTTGQDGGKSKEMMSGAGKMTEDEVAALAKAADPKGQLPKALASIVGLQYMYDFHLNRGDARTANKIAAAMIQRSQDLANQYGDIAEKAIKRGDITTAIRAIKEAHDAIPDGRRLKPAPGGMALVDDTTGKTEKVFRVTPQVILDAALGLKGGGAYKLLLERLTPTSTTGRTAGKTKTDPVLKAPKPIPKFDDLFKKNEGNFQDFFDQPKVGQPGVGNAGDIANSRGYELIKMFPQADRSKAIKDFQTIGTQIQQTSGYDGDRNILPRVVAQLITSGFKGKDDTPDRDSAGNIIFKYEGQILRLPPQAIYSIQRLQKSMKAHRDKQEEEKKKTAAEYTRAQEVSKALRAGAFP